MTLRALTSTLSILTVALLAVGCASKPDSKTAVNDDEKPVCTKTYSVGAAIPKTICSAPMTPAETAAMQAELERDGRLNQVNMPSVQGGIGGK